jgi:hypothetical protein
VPKKKEFSSLMEMMEFFRETGREGGKIGGKIAAANMTDDERLARAKKAAAASALVRTKKALDKRKVKKGRISK